VGSAEKQRERANCYLLADEPVGGEGGGEGGRARVGHGIAAHVERPQRRCGIVLERQLPHKIVNLLFTITN